MKPYTSQDSVAGGLAKSANPPPPGLTATESPTVDRIPATAATTQIVGFGLPGTGYINSGTDVDWFRVHLTAGVRYTVSETAPGALSDPNLDLRDAGGASLASYMHNNLVGPQISFTVAADGDYYLSASSHNGSTGSYSLQFIDSVKDDKTSNATLAQGTHALGVLETPTDTDWYAVNVTAGVTYDFSLTGYGDPGVADPFLRLYNTFGSSLTFNDNVNSTDNNAVVHYTATTTGLIFLAAGASSSAATGDRIGTYDLHYAVSVDDYAGDATTAGTVNPGGSVSGAIEVEGDHDWFAVTLQAGKIYNFALAGSGASPVTDGYLELFDANGTLIGHDDDSGPDHDPSLNYYAQTGGIYYISAENFPNAPPAIPRPTAA
ncbi:MAG: PPC domain-containing protein [Asticcacaulis sp.]